MSQWWSWTLAAIGVAGLFLAGSNRKAGWAIGLGVQALWIAYAVATRQWGFIASAIAYGVVYARNWWRWRSREAARPTYGVGERAPERYTVTVDGKWPKSLPSPLRVVDRKPSDGAA